MWQYHVFDINVQTSTGATTVEKFPENAIRIVAKAAVQKSTGAAAVQKPTGRKKLVEKAAPRTTRRMVKKRKLTKNLDSL